MLRLISSNPPSLNHRAQPVTANNKPCQFSASSQQCLLFNFQEISQDLYRATFHDLPHGLVCNLTLEKRSIYIGGDEPSEEGGFPEPAQVCYFPTIDTQRFSPLIRCDDYLQAMLTIQFQLNILEQLLLFCEEQDTAYLVLNFNESNLDYVEIYQQFLISQEEIITSRGEQTEIIIPADVSIYDAVLDFMDKVNREFVQTLWRDQRVNAAYRSYLKSQAILGNG